MGREEVLKQDKRFPGAQIQGEIFSDDEVQIIIAALILYYFQPLDLPPRDLPSFDLAVLSSCSHSIIDYGSFSFWAAYLAGGRTIVADRFMQNK